MHAIYNQVKSKISDIIDQKDYKSMIQVYNNKGLSKQISGLIGVKKPHPQVILDLLKGDKRQEIITAIKEYLPNI